MSEIDLIPQPNSLKQLDGYFKLSPSTPVLSNEPASEIANLFCQWVNPATGFSLSARPESDIQPKAIIFEIEESSSRLGPEGYTLLVQPEGIFLRAGSRNGLHYAAQT